MKKMFLVVMVCILALTMFADNDFRSAWREGFMETCAVQPAQRPACECVADRLLELYPGDRITRFSLRMVDGKMTPDDKANLVDVFGKCKNKKKGGHNARRQHM